MEVGRLNGLRIEVLTRDEHCPPHVHVDGDSWQARFEFAYWHDDVKLYSLSSNGRKMPSQRQLDELCRAVEQPAVLCKAREAFWSAVNSVCLDNQRWDSGRSLVVDPKNGRKLPEIRWGTFHSYTEKRDGRLTRVYETRLFIADSHIVLQHGI